MKHFLRFFFFIPSLFFAGDFLSALTLADRLSQLSPQQITQLKQEGFLRSSSDKAEDLFYLPKTEPFLSIQKDLASKQNKTNLEAVYYIPNMPMPSALRLQNSLLKITTLAGLQYYSRSEKIVKTLIYELYPVDEKTLQKTADPSVSKITSKISFRVFQDDETFGKAHYQITMTYYPSAIFSVHIKNIQPLKKGIFTMAKEGESELFMNIIPVDNDLLIYALSSTRQAPPAFVKKNADESLFNRMDAYKNWIITRYKAASA